MKNLTALLLLLPVFASADPGSATRYLINEPASLMDIGMMKLEQMLGNLEERAMVRCRFVQFCINIPVGCIREKQWEQKQNHRKRT